MVCKLYINKAVKKTKRLNKELAQCYFEIVTLNALTYRKVRKRNAEALSTFSTKRRCCALSSLVHLVFILWDMSVPLSNSSVLRELFPDTWSLEQ